MLASSKIEMLAEETIKALAKELINLISDIDMDICVGELLQIRCKDLLILLFEGGFLEFGQEAGGLVGGMDGKIALGFQEGIKLKGQEIHLNPPSAGEGEKDEVEPCQLSDLEYNEDFPDLSSIAEYAKAQPPEVVEENTLAEADGNTLPVNIGGYDNRSKNGSEKNKTENFIEHEGDSETKLLDDTIVDVPPTLNSMTYA